MVQPPWEPAASENAAQDPFRDYDPPLPTPDSLARYGARLLDPHQSLQLKGQPMLRNTVYVVDRLLVPPAASPETSDLLHHAAEQRGYRLEMEDNRERQDGVRRVWIRPATEAPTLPPDA